MTEEASAAAGCFMKQVQKDSGDVTGKKDEQNDSAIKAQLLRTLKQQADRSQQLNHWDQQDELCGQHMRDGLIIKGTLEVVEGKKLAKGRIHKKQHQQAGDEPCDQITPHRIRV